MVKHIESDKEIQRFWPLKDKEFLREYGKTKTVLLSTHIMSDLQEIADYLILVGMELKYLPRQKFLWILIIVGIS